MVDDEGRIAKMEQLYSSLKMNYVFAGVSSTEAVGMLVVQMMAFGQLTPTEHFRTCVECMCRPYSDMSPYRACPQLRRVIVLLFSQSGR